MLADMDARGLAALQDYSAKFDNFNLSKDKLGVSKEEIETKATMLTEEQKEAIDFCYLQCLEVQKEIAAEIKPIEKISGYGRTSFIPKPMERIGVYVPGGLAPLPSSLMMAGISARVAGVKEIIVCTPPRTEGLNPAIAYLAKKLGINEVYLLGGVVAIWFLANGLEGISRPVDKICGPGNIYVAEAKNQLAQSGKVGIDMIAGPSEVFILGDETANARFVAADLLAQAEHGTNSSAILVTDSREFALNVQQEVREQLGKMRRKEAIAKALENCGGIFIVRDLETEGAKLANEFGPEHLEIFCREELSQTLVQNACRAGAVFVGTGEAFADYGATGGNHILPTGGTIRFSSGLSAKDFFVWRYAEQLSPNAQKQLSKRVSLFAELENLEAHSNAAKLRGERYE